MLLLVYGKFLELSARRLYALERRLLHMDVQGRGLISDKHHEIHLLELRFG